MEIVHCKIIVFLEEILRLLYYVVIGVLFPYMKNQVHFLLKVTKRGLYTIFDNFSM